VVAVVGATGCGGGGARATPGAPTTVTASQLPGAPTVVVLKNISFTPSTVTIGVGQTILWRWDDGLVSHNVDFGAFKSGYQTQGGEYSHTFDSPGAYHYRCDIHPAMTATVEVSG